MILGCILKILSGASSSGVNYGHFLNLDHVFVSVCECIYTQQCYCANTETVKTYACGYGCRAVYKIVWIVWV